MNDPHPNHPLPPTEFFLEARGVSKSFPGVQALAGVDLTVRKGEVRAVVGENGAGKSTLMKILGGVQEPDAGTILIDGQPIRLQSVKDAERLGIVLIHQELNLAEQLDVAANVFLGREPTWGGPLRLLHPRIYQEAQAITAKLGLECSPRARVADLPVGQQQLVELARALSLRSRLLILDEPTSSLTERETERLFGVLRELKNQGITIIYISHRLKEVEAIADHVSVLRDGRNAGELSKSEIRHEAIVRLMVGRELKQFYPRNRPEVAPSTAPLLEVDGLSWTRRADQKISFALRPGEIVGMAGLMGSGRTELAETLFGVRRRSFGQVRQAGRPLTLSNPGQAIAAGIFLVPEDRRLQGLVLPFSVKHNLSLPSLDRLNRLWMILTGPEEALARNMIERLGVRTPGPNQRVELLSGGNQQKVVLAKWLSRGPRVLILDEPTRGIDVGARGEIYGLMDALAREGMAILMISSDLEEILGMSDRVLVMHEGRIAGELERGRLSEEAIMHLATGGG